MANKTWVFDVQGNRHVVEVEHIYLGASRTIRVDGKVVEKTRKLCDTGSEHRFEVEGAKCLLRARSGLFGFKFELFVDGRIV